MISLSTLRADAEALARQLPGLSLQAAAADVIHPGAAGRKRSGSGEQFWQYRRYAQTDAADRIDWRRSARGDEYFVRETELETARTILSWVDPHAGFDWSSAPGRETKADRARIILLAQGIVFAKQGERIGLISGSRPPSLFKNAPDRRAEDMLRALAEQREPPRAQALAGEAELIAVDSSSSDRTVPLLEAAGFRVETDLRSEKVGRKIRDAEVEKVPYMLVVGGKEVEAGTVAVRRQAEGDRGAVPTAEFIAALQQEVAEQLGRA